MCAPLNGLREAWNGSGGVGDRRMGLGLTSKAGGGKGGVPLGGRVVRKLRKATRSETTRAKL